MKQEVTSKKVFIRTLGWPYVTVARDGAGDIKEDKWPGVKELWEKCERKVYMKCLNILLVFIIGLSICFVGNAASEKENVEMKVLKIKWQRLISKGETCPRCGSTEKEVDKAVSILSQSLAPLGIEVMLEKTGLSVSEFKKNPLQSNQIWINNRLLEDWIKGKVDKSPCCDVCGPSECRTLEVKGKVYEAIPADVIVQAGLLAAAEIVENKPTVPSCCKPKIKSPKEKSCCH